MPEIPHALVTGATGFIGAHIIDQLLERGIRVRGTTRNLERAQRMIDARPQFAGQLDFVQIKDFCNGTSFEDTVKGVDGIVHAASPLTYNTTDNEKELIIPAINGVKAILSAAAKTGKVKRVVLTSSFASVIDVGKKAGSEFTYTADDWNPLTYEEACAPETSAVIAYRGSKKFAEVEAWNFVEREKPSFDLVTFCPPMTFGPVVHDVRTAADLNESNANIWKVAIGEPLPEARVPVWVDVRDLAKAHVAALFREEASGKRYTIAASDKFSYELAASILRRHFDGAMKRVVDIDDEMAPKSYHLDNEAVSRDLDVTFQSFETSVVDLFEKLERDGISPWK